MEESSSWQQIIFLFFIASVTGVIVSYAVNKYIKTCSVFVVQLSMLITLFLYPMLNAYLFAMLTPGLDNVLYGNIDCLSYNSAMFFAPLPTCILVTLLFSLCRKRYSFEQLASAKSQPTGLPILRNASRLLSVIMGAIWFVATLRIISYQNAQERLMMLLLLTVYGLIASFVAWIIFRIEQRFS